MGTLIAWFRQIFLEYRIARFLFLATLIFGVYFPKVSVLYVYSVSLCMLLNCQSPHQWCHVAVLATGLVRPCRPPQCRVHESLHEVNAAKACLVALCLCSNDAYLETESGVLQEGLGLCSPCHFRRGELSIWPEKFGKILGWSLFLKMSRCGKVTATIFKRRFRLSAYSWTNLKDWWAVCIKEFSSYNWNAAAKSK